MSDELSPSELARTHYLRSLHASASASKPPTARALTLALLDLHRDAWRLATVEVQSVFPGWPFGDEARAYALEASVLNTGIDALHAGEVPQMTERVAWAMLGAYLDYLEAEDLEKPYLTHLTEHVGSELYHALPVDPASLSELSLSVGPGTDFDDMTFEYLEDEDDLLLADPSSDPSTQEANDPWGAAVTSRSDQPAETESAPIRGLHWAPVLESDPVQGAHTHGGFFPSDWETYLRQPHPLTKGVWVVNRFPAEGKLALHFIGEHYSAFGELFQEHVSDVHVAAKGLNLAIEVSAADGGKFVAVGPKRRMKAIFRELGFSL